MFIECVKVNSPWSVITRDSYIRYRYTCEIKTPCDLNVIILTNISHYISVTVLFIIPKMIDDIK